jgi:hypothetical protein
MAERPAAPPAARRAAVAVLTALAVAALLVFLLRQRAYIAAHYALHPGVFALLAGLVVLVLALRSAAHRALFSRLGIRAGAADWFRLVTVSTFTNYLPLAAGLLAKAVFLKRVHALPYGSFAVGQVALLLIIVSANGAAGLLALAALHPDRVAGLLGAGLLAMTATALLLWLPGLPLPGPLRRRIPWDGTLLPGLRRAFWPVALLQVLVLLATAASLRLAFALGTADVPFAACVVFSAAAMLTRLVAITPGAIGIREFFVGVLALATGFELRDAVIAATAARTVEVAVVFALGSLFTRRVSGEALAA